MPKSCLMAISLMVVLCAFSFGQSQGWEIIETVGQPTARHEAALVAFKGKLYLIGGRRINPVDVYDPATNTWTAKSKTPIELHHFQAVVYEDGIYLIGAMTGGYPRETPLEKVIVYYPEKDEFKYVHSIPEARRRGGAGAVLYQDKIYVVGGITNGHVGGYRPWLDEYDPRTGSWTALADAPHARDHFQATVAGDKLYAVAGRTSSQGTNDVFNLTVSQCDVYDFATKEWASREIAKLPTERAGNMVASYNGRVIVGGGESGTQNPAHNEVEIYDPKSNVWRSAPKLNRGRHGSGFAIIGDYLYTASGCGNRGGSPELTTLERIPVDSLVDDAKQIELTKKWHPKVLSFVGPQTSETAIPNPFTDYRLLVEFTHKSSGEGVRVRGYYAADGNAANSHATDGNVWQAVFAPDQVGIWTWKASLRTGKGIAVDESPSVGANIELQNASGKFEVVSAGRPETDFRSRGRVVVENQRFKFEGSENGYWLKAGADSPENLLAFADFDGTYRIAASNDDGEAKTDGEIHQFAPQVRDWNEGDLTWMGQDGKQKGKGLVGAINYLASKKMNSVYFLTMNINGDGKDVWPYLKPDDFSRFDCSKLAQWELVFDTMQSKGIALHVQLQETENETLLDGGDTGPLRKLYFRELVSRFGHHPALIWNLGEENGPAEWTPIGQTSEQRIAMADYLKSVDPYNHPVVMHTHADMHSKDKLLTPLLGKKSIDGLSFQVDKREMVHGEFAKWFARSKGAGHPWLISMDEIGIWHTGAKTDAEDPNHDTLRRYVLWGSFLAGGAGVEWYFGAKSPHNDLTSEDWRQRDRLWDLTRSAAQFFEQHLPWWQMENANKLVEADDTYCLAKRGEVYAVYLHRVGKAELDLEQNVGTYSVRWYDPLNGGDLKKGTVEMLQGPGVHDLGKPPKSDAVQDWVALVKKQEE